MIVKKAWIERHRAARRQGGHDGEKQNQPGVPVQLLRDTEAAHGAHEHHALDAEVEHPGAFGEELAEPGEDKWGPESDGRDHDGEDDVEFMTLPLSALTVVGELGAPTRGAGRSGSGRGSRRRAP